MLGRRVVLVAVAALVAATATTAHAVSLSLSSATLYAMSGVADAMPAQLAYDDFNTGSTLAGRTALAGQPWNVVQGTFGINGGQLRCTSCNSYGVALVDADLAEVTASVDVRATNGAGTSGLMVNADETGSTGFAVWYDSGTVQVLRYSAGATTPLAQTVVPKPVNNTFATLIITYGVDVYTVSFNGATVLTHTLGPTDKAVADAGTYFGVIMYNPSGNARLDTFEVRR